jgi:hypothetical protein
MTLYYEVRYGKDKGTLLRPHRYPEPRDILRVRSLDID